MSAYDELIKQIDAFIRKYYKNEMLKGLILFSALLLLSYLVVISLEFFGRFGSGVRAALFYTFIGVNLFLASKYLILPLSKLFAFGRRINRHQASRIIGEFFPEVSDRLLNTLQLNESLEEHNANYELIRASVLQRSKTLTVVPFSSGIKLKENLVYMKYVGPVFALFLLLAILFPSFISQGTKRVVQYNKEFKPEAPFKFLLESDELTIREGDDYPVELLLKGTEIPEKIYLISSEGKFLMRKKSKVRSFFVLKRLKESGSFYFEANGFSSKRYQIKVVPRSSVGKFTASIKYPAYLGRKNEEIENAGDLMVPEGSTIEWSIATKNVSRTKMKFQDTTVSFGKQGFRFAKRFRSSSELQLILWNENESFKDSMNYRIDVVKDQLPSIEVREQKDSISEALRFFEGSLADDQGLSRLEFVYKVIGKDGKERIVRKDLSRPSGTSQPFRHAVDFRSESLQVEDRIEYYFVVYDNDGVNGSKSTRSQKFDYRLPSLSELNDKRDESQEDAKNKMNELLNRTKDFQKNVERLKKKVLNEKGSDWNQLNQVQQLQEERESLKDQLEKLQMEMNESISEKQQLSQMDEELLEKQELIEELLEEVMDDELKELLEKLEELMKKQDQNNLERQLDQLDMKAEDMKEQMDRSLEMLKRMQVTEKAEDIIKELKELSEEQEKLKDEMQEGKKDSEEGMKDQQEIQEKFDDLKKEMEKLDDLNENLKRPMNLGDQEDLKQEVDEQMKEAKEKLSKGKEKKASENQQKSSEKMEQMAEEMEQMLSQSNMQQQQEDIDLLRNILESLMTLSFDQEDVMNRFRKVRDKDPYYVKLGKNQRRIVDDTRIVEDSLKAIADRQPKISSFIMKELNTIQMNFDQGLENIDEHRRRQLNMNLQYVMTGYNNLALMLNESLQQMQMQMQNQMQGSGSCDKPNSGKGKPLAKPGEGDMKEMLKKQLEQMQKAMDGKGQKDGKGKKPGKGQEGQQGMMGMGSQQLAKMAAKQALIRQRIEKLKNELNKDGKGQGNQLNPLLNELESQQRDLINKNLNKQMINRQKRILTRLLESEKAMMERGFDEKRESKVGKNRVYGNQNRIEEYNKQKLRQIELLRSVDPVFKKYYKDKASEYFNLVN
ncbi:MAG: hypothetical protein EP338_00815 [Bacteroidetes bacterium]|nr:MAG: hypothetical protein EP338_00815 [Bacteroidota bacterium]